MKTLNFINKSIVIINRFFSISSLVIITTLFLTGCNNKELKTGYIDINQINKEYKVAKTYESLIKNLENTTAGNLLGLQAELNILQDSIKHLKERKETPSQVLLKQYFNNRNEFEAAKKQQMETVQDSILYYRSHLNSKINNLVYEFAQEKGYHYVYSPAGSGTFMYADSSLNITKEVIVYLNSK